MTKQKVMPPERLETLFLAITFAIEECRCIFPAGWREKFFWIFGHKKKAQNSVLWGLAPCWVLVSVGLYDYSAGCVQGDVNNIFSECFHRGGGCVVGLQHFGQLCACVLSDFRQVVFFRL